MRSPLLIESSKFIVEPNEKDKKRIFGGESVDIPTTLYVSEDLNVEEASTRFFENKRLKWVLKPSVNEEAISFEIQKYPIKNNSLPSGLQDQVLSKIDAVASNNRVQMINEDAQKILNPVFYDEFLIDIIEDIGFEIENIDGNKISKNADIGNMVIKNRDLKFSDSFSFTRFNEAITNLVTERAEELIEELANPYQELFTLDSLSPFFAKHGEKAVEFWSLYKDKIFLNNPSTNSDRCLNQFINSEKSRYQFFRVWYDLMSNIKFEIVDLDNEETRKIYKSSISDEISADSDQITFPWRQEEYKWVTGNLLTRYKPEDFAYDSDKLAPNTLIKLSAGNINYIYEVQKYGKCDNLGGELIPKGWLAKTVATSPRDKDEQISREKLYESLNKSNCCRYLTKEEISQCEICTDDAVKPAVRTEDEYADTYKNLKKKQRYEKRIKRCLQDGYKIKDLTLQDLVEEGEIKFGYNGWHTGTISPQFPIVVSIDDGQSYKSYKKFEDEGVVSYKTGFKVRIKPDWEKIIGQTTEDLSENGILHELSRSNYSQDKKLVVVVHNLP